MKAFFTKGVDIAICCTPSITRRTDEKDFDQLMFELKTKFQQTTSLNEKIQILTLNPKSWTIEQTVKFFNATTYQVRTAMTLKKNEGVLSKPKRSVRKGIDQDSINNVISFYLDDEFSREMPGAKEYVSIGYKQHKQKRLLLGNLSELYAAFKEKFQDSKVGFSKFCALCPKWCKTIGSSVTHSVCVCAIHQNTILACRSLNLNYKDLIRKVVCDNTNKLCMIHRCPKCPGKNNRIEYLYQIIPDNTEEEINFQEWESADRTTIVNMVMQKFEFIEFLAKKIDLLTAHSYIAKSQAKYLSILKENLLSSTCIMLADFAENYSMVVQDAVQGWHWTKQQCTIHPIIIYY